LTDVGHGAMLHIEGFVDGAERAEPLPRDFSPDCVPIRGGLLRLI
jgi:hypothetical protein